MSRIKKSTADTAYPFLQTTADRSIIKGILDIRLIVFSFLPEPLISGYKPYYAFLKSIASTATTVTHTYYAYSELFTEQAAEIEEGHETINSGSIIAKFGIKLS